MATPDDARFIQQRLGYNFKDEGILLLALTAAGKGGTEDGQEKQGNSRLAHFGNYLMQFLLAWVGFSGDRTRGSQEEATILRTQLSSLNHCAKVAENADLNRCLKYDMRSGSRSAAVLRKALNATIAAVFVDSRDLDKALQVAQNIGLLSHNDFGIDPQLLTSNQAGAIDSFRSGTRPAGVQQPLEEVSQGTGSTLTHETNQISAGLNFLEASNLLMDMSGDRMDFFNDIFDGTIPARDTELEVVATGARKPRRSISDNRRVQRDDNDVAFQATSCLRQYLAEERERCISHHIEPPEETFFTRNIEEELRELGKKHANTIMLIQVLIASSYAFVALRELVFSYKEGDHFHLWHVHSTLAAQARFNIIQHLDGKISAYGILRRYHILHLFRESVPADSRVLTNFINMNPTDFRRTKRSGNPENNAKSEVTNVMMKAIYPDLNPCSAEYKLKYRAISRLRLLGERYHALVERFQMGVLGLLPLSGLVKPFDTGLSERMILALPDPIFDELLAILDRTQGDFLRRSSEAAMRLIAPLMNNTFQRSKQFQIELCEMEDIIQHPKRSADLLRLLDQV